MNQDEQIRKKLDKDIEVLKEEARLDLINTKKSLAQAVIDAFLGWCKRNRIVVKDGKMERDHD